MPDITLIPATDDTYAILPRATASDDSRRAAVHRRLVRAGIGWFLGFDPKSATDRVEVERRIAKYAGADLTVAWSQP